LRPLFRAPDIGLKNLFDRVLLFSTSEWLSLG